MKISYRKISSIKKSQTDISLRVLVIDADLKETRTSKEVVKCLFIDQTGKFNAFFNQKTKISVGTVYEINHAFIKQINDILYLYEKPETIINISKTIIKNNQNLINFSEPQNYRRLKQQYEQSESRSNKSSNINSSKKGTLSNAEKQLENYRINKHNRSYSIHSSESNFSSDSSSRIMQMSILQDQLITRGKYRQLASQYQQQHLKFIKNVQKVSERRKKQILQQFNSEQYKNLTKKQINFLIRQKVFEKQYQKYKNQYEKIVQEDKNCTADLQSQSDFQAEILNQYTQITPLKSERKKKTYHPKEVQQKKYKAKYQFIEKIEKPKFVQKQSQTTRKNEDNKPKTFSSKIIIPKQLNAKDYYKNPEYR